MQVKAHVPGDTISNYDRRNESRDHASSTIFR